MKKLHVFYRISDKGESKEKPYYISNRTCLENFITQFPPEIVTIIADNVKDETWEWVQTYNFHKSYRTTLGNSASFWFSYNIAIQKAEDSLIYFVENDYLHKPHSMKILLEGLEIADYVTLYDHPDKYHDGLNPQIKKGGEKSKVFLTNSTHWKQTNSTTMTFASNVSSLKKDKLIFKLFTVGIIKKGSIFFKRIQERRFPADYRIFSFLTKIKKRSLISSLPAYSCHGEIANLAPLFNWEVLITDKNK